MSGASASPNVFLFVPNLIGYTRVVCVFVAFFLAHSHHMVCAFLYLLDFVLDGVDGHVARYLNQSSMFGALLDMVTDRFSTAGLCVILCHYYHAYEWWFILVISLDMTSHYMHMYATFLRGGGSHKAISPKESTILRVYYANKWTVFTPLCIGNELFFIFLYIAYFEQGVWSLLTRIFFPLMLCKQIVNVFQMLAAAETAVASHRTQYTNKTR